METLLLFPPAPDNPGRFVPHLGAAYLQAALAKQGIPSEQYVDPRPGSLRQVVERIAARAPRVVGLTTYDENLSLAVALAAGLKQVRAQTRIVLGGPGVLASWQVLLAQQPAIEVCFRGEAEVGGPALFEALLADARLPLPAIPGVACRGAGDQIVDHGVAPAIRDADAEHDLDGVPSPYLTGMLRDGRAGLLTGRGCNQHCTFCCFAALGGRRLRLHGEDRVVAELEWIARQGERGLLPTPVQLFDDTFSLLPGRAKRLCERIARADLGLRLSCITRADRVDAELLRLMKAAGVRAVAFGLESAVPRVLRGLGKVRPPDSEDPLAVEEGFLERVRSAVAEARLAGLAVGVSVILGGPGETAADAAETIRFVEGLGVDYYLQNPLRVYRGTPLWEARDRCGLETRLDPDGVPQTIGRAYEVGEVRPAANCIQLEELAQLRRLSAALLEGCASPLAPAVRIGAVILRADRIVPAVATWLAEHLAVGGLLIQIFAAQVDLRRAAACRRQLEAKRVPFRQLVQLGRGSADDCFKMTHPLAGLVAATPTRAEIRSRPGAESFGRWLAGESAPGELFDPVPLLAGHDAAARRLAAEARAGDDGAPQPIHPGRFYAGSAACAGLSRIEIDARGEIRVCRLVEPIGSVADEPSVLARGLRGRLAGDGLSGRCPLYEPLAERWGAPRVDELGGMLERVRRPLRLGEED